jgi:CheY-like chemotaxis protein
MNTVEFNIVIADDDIDDQHVIKQAIAETNISYKTFIVNNGLELMDMLLSKGKYENQGPLMPQLIIMDLNMPLLDGYGVLTRLKSNNDLKNIPVYMLSTSRFEYDKQKSVELGAIDFFSKPYQFEELKNIIREICTKTADEFAQRPV